MWLWNFFSCSISISLSEAIPNIVILDLTFKVTFECPCKYVQRYTSFSFCFYPFMYQLSKSIHYQRIENFKMSYGREKMQQNAHGMYVRSLNSGLTTTIYFYHIRRTFHSLTGACYSGYARTALSKSYKIQATLSSILHSLPPLLSSPLSSPPSSLPLALLTAMAFFITTVHVVECYDMLTMTR